MSTPDSEDRAAALKVLRSIAETSHADDRVRIEAAEAILRYVTVWQTGDGPLRPTTADQP